MADVLVELEATGVSAAGAAGRRGRCGQSRAPRGRCAVHARQRRPFRAAMPQSASAPALDSRTPAGADTRRRGRCSRRRKRARRSWISASRCCVSASASSRNSAGCSRRNIGCCDAAAGQRAGHGAGRPAPAWRRRPHRAPSRRRFTPVRHEYRVGAVQARDARQHQVSARIRC